MDYKIRVHKPELEISILNQNLTFEKVLDYLDKIIPKRSIKGFYKFGGET